MKLHFTILIIISFANISLAQNLTLSDSSLIRKNKIKTAKSKSITKNILDEIWEFDKNGLLISNEILWTDDSIKNIDLFFYKNNLLVEKWNIGLWSDTTSGVAVYDTMHTLYTYNNNNQILIQKGEGCRLSFSNTYENGILVSRKYESKEKCYHTKGTDTLIYNKQKQLVKTLNYLADECYTYTYDSNGKAIGEIKSSISDSTKIEYKYYHYYEKGKRTKAVQIRYAPHGRQISEACYSYYKNGMAKKLISTYNTPFTHYKYRYKFIYEYY